MVDRLTAAFDQFINTKRPPVTNPESLEKGEWSVFETIGKGFPPSGATKRKEIPPGTYLKELLHVWMLVVRITHCLTGALIVILFFRSGSAQFGEPDTLLYYWFELFCCGIATGVSYLANIILIYVGKVLIKIEQNTDDRLSAWKLSSYV